MVSKRGSKRRAKIRTGRVDQSAKQTASPQTSASKRHRQSSKSRSQTTSGGTIAAFGLKYQYLSTLDYFLEHLRANENHVDSASLVIEPLLLAADDKTDDIVDFGIDLDGHSDSHVQVKASVDPSSNPLQPAVARDVLIRLSNHGSRNAVLLTNKPLSPQMTAECEPTSADGAMTTYAWLTGPDGQGDQNMRIIVDERPIAAVRESVCTHIQHFRADQALSQGQTSARLLVAIVVDHIFGAAAGVELARISGTDLVGMLRMPDRQIAHVAGGFDWGLPITGIPNYAATVPRLSLLDEIIEHLTPEDATTQPRRVVLFGHTGVGKSVIASDYCHVDKGAYEFICWVDCREPTLVESQLRDIVGQLTREYVLLSSDIAPVFTGILGRHRGPWLVVFDGVRKRADIDRYMPTQGNGCVLLTSTNSLSWWPDAYQREVRVFRPTKRSTALQPIPASTTRLSIPPGGRLSTSSSA